jgi:hypothetical protein
MMTACPRFCRHAPEPAPADVQVTGGTLAERQAAQAAIIAQDEMNAAVATLQRPGAASGSENGAAPQGMTNPAAETDAAARAQVS